MPRSEGGEAQPLLALPDFNLPDLTPPSGKERKRVETVKFPISYRGEDFIGSLECTRYADPKEGSEGDIATIYLQVFDKADPKSSIARFASHLSQGLNPAPRYLKTDENPFLPKCWNISTREVAPGYRGQGLGELGIRVSEELIARIAKAYPELDAKWIVMATGLSSLSRLIVDQSWLKEHGLERFAHKGGQNLGYRPHPADEQQAKELLQQNFEEAEDIPAGAQRVLFMKARY